ncbi:Ankyrin repeat protein 2 [Giardia muris]|uniref:Ankyrin repeat protein 2 n=1 Tax=Giardia muris TaxID=5742 RepID=A0A4Z1SN66_GIAMU|nr:Ankyrin repeat protein 2 [Giardia muris]|eukprot:TNJ27040.1 Ankyrin repeat protein 2 [Giardia muris]
MSDTALMKAAKAGDLEAMRANLNEVGRKDENGGTALMRAALRGHINCVQLLLSETGGQTTRNCNGLSPGATALMLAAHRNHIEIVQLLIPYEQKMKNNNGETALMQAAMWGHVNCIPLLEGEIGMQDNWGLTALMHAAYNGKTDCARLLLSEAGKQTTKEWYGFPPRTTALMMAARRNHPDIVELLLLYEQGMENFYKHTAKWHAYNSSKKGNFTRVCELLENEGTERIPPPSKGPLMFLVSAVMGDVDGIQKNLSYVGYQGPNGMTALMLAAEKGHTNCIPLLKREIGKQNRNGETALMRTAYNGHKDCIFLLEKEIGMQNKNGWTALMLAAAKGHAKCIPLLRKELGMRDNYGNTTLMKAAYNGHKNCVQLLLSEAGKKTTDEWENTFDGYLPGMTALMIAAHRNRPDIVELLLPYEQGMKDSKGHTAQWYANNGSRGGDFTRVRQLLENEGTERIPPPTPGAAGRRGVKKLSSSRSLPEGMTCVICLTNPKDTLLQPCKHICTCSGCSSQLKGQTCPLCRTPIDNTVKVYL